MNFYYDADGNILLKTDGTNGYSYVYGSSSNRMTSLYYNGIGSTYNYDNTTGNLIYDGKKKLTLSYNIKNFPMQLTDVNNKTTQYRYDENGNRVYKYNTSVNEFYFVDPSGRELASYDIGTKKLKSVNLYGNDMIGRVNVTWDIELVPAKRYDERFYYIKDHLGNNRFTIDTTGTTVVFNDYTPDGKTYVDSKGNVMSYTVKDGVLVSFQNATPDFVRIANSLSQTKTGMAQLEKGRTSSIDVEFFISSKTRTVPKEGGNLI